MRRGDFISWTVVALSASIGFGVAIHQWHRARQFEAAAGELERQREPALNELYRWETRNTAIGQTKGTPSAESDKPFPPALPAGGEEREPKTPPTYAERLQKDPEFQRLHLASNRAELVVTYGALFRKLKFPPEKIDAFMEIAARRDEREMDLQAVVELSRLTSEDPAAKAMEQKNKDVFAQEARALLGEADYAEFEQYEKTIWSREMVAGWAGGATVMLGEPFTPEQGESLVDILANASSLYREGGFVNITEPGYWNLVEARARKILSPAQLQLITTMEPPLPSGARFQSHLTQKIQDAIEAEKARRE